MSERLEDRLSGALRRRAGDDESESVAGLAAGARARAARRARRRTAGVVVAAALAVAAVPTVIALNGSSPSVGPAPSPPATSDGVPTPDDPPTGVRVESWRNLTVSVPPGWGYTGSGTDWCAADGTPNRPTVARSEGGARSIGCTPQLSYGLHFVDGSAIRWAVESGEVWQYRWDSPDQVKMYPEDAWLGHFRVGDQALMVVTRDEATARAVVDSARKVTGTDPNGCAPRDVSDVATGDGDRWSVCRYSGDGWLVQSELLTADQSAQFLAAVQAAPPVDSAMSCPAPAPDDESVGRVVVGNGSDLGSVSLVFESYCPGANGVFLSGTTRQLTADVLYWALSPGWQGGVDGSVPLPDQFRQN